MSQLHSLNILVIGLGSIGKRHLKNIIGLGYKNISVVTRTGKADENFSGVHFFSSIESAVSARSIDAAIICTPTARHTPDLQQLLQHGIRDIYIEKPAAHDEAGLQFLQTLTNPTQNRIVVGYDLRFDKGLQKLKQLISEETVGRPVTVNATVGQYLPDWRPHEDYAKGMSASIAKGGGVLLDLVHEFDYLYWLMGSVQHVAAYCMHSGSLNIETEDAVEVLLKFCSGVTGTVHLDYLQPQPVRNCMVTCTGGTIFWDMVLSEVKWVNRQKESFEFSYKGFERNDRFVQIMQTFLEGKPDPRLTSLEQGLESLKMVIAAKHASQHNMFVDMKTFNN